MSCWGVQQKNYTRHLMRLSATSPRHKASPADPQLWAFRCYPPALQLNNLISAFISQSPTTKNIQPFLSRILSQPSTENVNTTGKWTKYRNQSSFTIHSPFVIAPSPSTIHHPPFTFYFLLFTFHSSLITHNSPLTTHYFPIILSKLALPGPTSSNVIYAPKYKATFSPSPKTSK